MSRLRRIDEVLAILTALGMPRAQRNERSALCLLALLGLGPNTEWSAASRPLLGITPIMDWVHTHYGRRYAPNTRETFRRQTMHQFIRAGLVVYNPDSPGRPVNSPRAAYQIAPDSYRLLRSHGTKAWDRRLAAYLAKHKGLAARYAKERDMRRIPVRVASGQEIVLSPGVHSRLIKAVVEEFAPRFVPAGRLVYMGDTGSKWGYFDRERLGDLGVNLDDHGKMPDAVFHDPARSWLLLVEAVTSHGPVDAKRHDELIELFAGSSAGLVFVTAFPTRAVMAKYLGAIAWETEVWVAEAPTHLIHFDGERFLGPY